MARRAGDKARRRPTQIPAANIGELSVLGEHGRVRPDVGDGAAESAEVGVAGDVTKRNPPRQCHNHDCSIGPEERKENALDPIEILHALVEEALRVRQVRPRVRILGDPDAHVRVRRPHLSDMARQAAEVSVPVDRDKICAAVSRARGEELLQPCEARLRTRYGRGA